MIYEDVHLVSYDIIYMIYIYMIEVFHFLDCTTPPGNYVDLKSLMLMSDVSPTFYVHTDIIYHI
jgi:hypothetical protein